MHPSSLLSGTTVHWSRRLAYSLAWVIGHIVPSPLRYSCSNSQPTHVKVYNRNGMPVLFLQPLCCTPLENLVMALYICTSSVPQKGSQGYCSVLAALSPYDVICSGDGIM